MKFYKKLSLFYKSLSPLAKIHFSTIIFFAYYLLVILPYSLAYAPANEATTERGFSLAPFIYLLLFLPAFIFYLVAIIKNIGKIEKKRFIAYPICFITIFLAVHIFFITMAAVLCFLLIITVPIGFILFCIIEIAAIIRDIKGKKSLNKIDKFEDNKLDGNQKEELEKQKYIQEKNDKKVYKIFYGFLGTILILIVCGHVLFYIGILN